MQPPSNILLPCQFVMRSRCKAFLRMPWVLAGLRPFLYPPSLKISQRSSKSSRFLRACTPADRGFWFMICKQAFAQGRFPTDVRKGFVEWIPKRLPRSLVVFKGRTTKKYLCWCCEWIFPLIKAGKASRLAISGSYQILEISGASMKVKPFARSTPEHLHAGGVSGLVWAGQA